MSTRSQQIAEGLADVKGRIELAAQKAGRNPSEISLVVVTKTFPLSDLEILYSLGERNFGENRIADGAEKQTQLPDDINWHFQGQIQSNKIRKLLSWAQVIHSLDDLDHAKRIHDLTPVGEAIECFIQVSLDPRSDSSTRGGVWPEDLSAFVTHAAQFERINLRGLMAVAPLGEVPDLAFHRLSEIHQRTVKECASLPEPLLGLSAGMSGDFESAIAHGATLVRIGSSILCLR